MYFSFENETLKGGVSTLLSALPDVSEKFLTQSTSACTSGGEGWFDAEAAVHNEVHLGVATPPAFTSSRELEETALVGNFLPVDSWIL